MAERYKKIIRISGAAVAFRLAVYLLSFCIMILFGEYGSRFSLQDFLEGWTRWDAAHYIKIAEKGYGGIVEDGKNLMLVFYPLYPWCMRILQAIIHNTALCGIIISTLAFAGGCCYLYLLTEEELDAQTAWNTVILISIFPFSFFFGGIMTESLFLLVSAGALYYFRKHKWGWGVVFLFLSGLTRVQGVLLLLPALAELCTMDSPIRIVRERRYGDLSRLAGRAAMPVLGALASVWIYLGINYRVTGNPFQFMIYQKEHWHQGFGFLPDTIKYIWENMMHNGFTSINMALWIPELFLFGLGLLLMIYGWKKQPVSNSVYYIAYFICIYSATWLLSAGRYLSCAVPMFIAGGEWLTRHPKWRLPVYWVFSSFFMIYLIAYFLWKQVM